ncbi:hypothetical protein LTR17_010802 [Elasticomyces elasticus]|nr:hypothetical protein LTR17_010802 [Elasticomyces elasticus]
MDNGEQEVNDTRCRLLELPQELQDVIYELVAIHQSPIKVCQPFCRHYANGHCSSATQDWRKRVQPALLQTCSSIRSNVLPIYYKQNIYEICCCGGDVRGGETWLNGIGASNRAMLQRVTAHESIYYRLAELRGPRRLVIEVTADDNVGLLIKPAGVLDPPWAVRTPKGREFEAAGVREALRPTCIEWLYRYEMNLVKSSN